MLPTQRSHDGEEEDDDYFLAPQDQRVFGAGIKRKRVAFVPATTDSDSLGGSSNTTPRSNPDLGARYLDIVLGRRRESGRSLSEPPQSLQTKVNDNVNVSATRDNDLSTLNEPGSDDTNNNSDPQICMICNTAITTSIKTHEATIAHQLSLEHSHPPSHLDRQHVGLRYLQGYGWDVDSRLGLGARGEGIRMPVKAREKRDTAGLGLFSSEEDGDVNDGGKKKKQERREVPARVNLDAKQVRKMEEEKKRKAEKLRSTFYGDDLSQYLGPGG